MASRVKGLDPALTRRHLTEWLALTVLLLALMTAFVHYSHFVRGQAELAAIKTTVGALRTALVVEHLRQHVAGTGSASTQLSAAFNPFDLLQQKPAGYEGLVQRQGAGANVAPGSWVYDAQCPCVGYRPMDDQWFESPVDDAVLWFEVTGMPGVLQLVTKEKYRWNNEPVE